MIASAFFIRCVFGLPCVYLSNCIFFFPILVSIAGSLVLVATVNSHCLSFIFNLCTKIQTYQKESKTVARFTERLITYLSPKTYRTTYLRPKTCLILKICIKTCHKSILVVN